MASWSTGTTSGAAAALTLITSLALAASAGAVKDDIELASRASGADGAKAGGGAQGSRAPSISADGRLVAFTSAATNIHPDDANSFDDVYVRDLASATTILVSRASGADGVKATPPGVSIQPSISADGRFVAFASTAANIHPDKTTFDVADVFVRDLQAETTTLVSRASGASGPKGDENSNEPSISADGRFVAFTSEAANLHPDDPDHSPDIFVRDLQTDTTILASRASGAGGSKGTMPSGSPSISGDGRTVAFVSQSTNLHPDPEGTSFNIFVRDLDAETTAIASRADGDSGNTADGASAAPSVSADGRYVAFGSFASNLDTADAGSFSDIFVRDLQASNTALISRVDGIDGASPDGVGTNSTDPSISADGKAVAFRSEAADLAPGDHDLVDDVFVRDLGALTTALASRATGAAGAGGNGDSLAPAISGDGRFVAFESQALNLHPSDPDSTRDVFRRTFGLVPPVNLTTPALSGTPVAGETLTCSDGEWSEGTLSRSWRRDGAAIAGATAETYELTAGDVGTIVDCLVTATNADGSASATSNPTLVGQQIDETVELLALFVAGKFKATTGKKLKAGFFTTAAGRARLVLKRKKTKVKKAGEVDGAGLHRLAMKLVAKRKGMKRPIPPGKYKLKLRVTGEDGQKATDKARVTVRKPAKKKSSKK